MTVCVCTREGASTCGSEGQRIIMEVTQIGFQQLINISAGRKREENSKIRIIKSKTRWVDIHSMLHIIRNKK